MSGDHRDSSSSSTESLTLILGTVIVLATIGAWLYGKANGLELGELLAFVVPVVTALLIVKRVNAVHDTTKQVERQTNGELTRRLEQHREQVVAEVRAIVEGQSTPVDSASSSPPADS